MQHLKEIVLPNYPLILSLLKIVLPNYPLILSLLKYRNVWIFWNKKKKKFGPNKCSILHEFYDHVVT